MFKTLNTKLGLNLNSHSQYLVKSAARGAAVGVGINAVLVGAALAIGLLARR